MLKVGLIGLGAMGRTHLDNYIRLEAEGYPVKLVAICDIDETKFKGKLADGNMGTAALNYDLSKYNIYTDIDEMLENEELDYIDTPLPTYIHAETAVKALNKGINVFCEKPMALTTEQCQNMIDAAKNNGKKLMIGQCLRFWPAYEYLKSCVDDGKYGKTVSAYFFRGGGTPLWSYQNWLLTKEKSGGCLLDQHVHDVDTINWIFGKPDFVSTIARNVIPGSGYDAVSTNYIYPDGKVVNAQDDWTLNGDFGFQMTFRVNFEKAGLIFEKGKVTVYPHDSKAFIPELPSDDGYYREMKYYIDALINNTEIKTASPESTKTTIEIAQAEIRSADNMGQLIKP
jgi:predicted dehydrogenase